ncbi:MAG: HAMP domain-containing histidine kinase [Gemmataceae bacterium]|nr:HAMP domain-containing histidine kinase [Gemmataceae bacterium]
MNDRNALLADVGELAGTVAHEFNNFLNTLLLHIAVLEHRSPDAEQRELKDIRRQASAMAALIKQFQHYRRSQRFAPAPVDLNAIVRTAIERGVAEESPHAVALALAPDLPAALGIKDDLVRVSVFLVRNALRVSPSRVAVSTSHVAGLVILHIADFGPSVPAESLYHFFEPQGKSREAANGLELATCHSIVRRMGGKISAESGAEGGVVLTVQLPAAG